MRIKLNHMLNHSLVLDRAFAALADPVRRECWRASPKGRPRSPNSPSPPPRSALPAVPPTSEGAGGKRARRFCEKRRVRTVSMKAEALTAAESWLVDRRRKMEARLERFEDYVSTLKNGENCTGRRYRPLPRANAGCTRRPRVGSVDQARAHQALVGAATLSDARMRNRAEAWRQVLHAHDGSRRLRLQRHGVRPRGRAGRTDHLVEHDEGWIPSE